MLNALALVLLFADAPANEGGATLPRRVDEEALKAQEQRGGKPTDPWFDRQFVATDDPAFIITAIDSGRQGIADAGALGGAATPALSATAAKIEKVSRDTTVSLEKLAKKKGWRVPEQNPDRAPTVAQAGPARTRANYVVHQIAYHQSTIQMFRAQIGGKGDAELKRALESALPAYEANLRVLLELEPASLARAATQ